jgi:hypothetical protein
MIIKDYLVTLLDLLGASQVEHASLTSDSDINELGTSYKLFSIMIITYRSIAKQNLKVKQECLVLLCIDRNIDFEYYISKTLFCYGILLREKAHWMHL